MSKKDKETFNTRSPFKQGTSITQASRSMLHDSRVGLVSVSKDFDGSASHLKLMPVTPSNKREENRKHEMFLAQLKARHVQTSLLESRALNLAQKRRSQRKRKNQICRVCFIA